MSAVVKILLTVVALMIAWWLFKTATVAAIVVIGIAGAIGVVRLLRGKFGRHD